jgi:hypothetical protein
MMCLALAELRKGRDHTIAPSLGAPFSLRLKDCDLEPLNKEDFVWGPVPEGFSLQSSRYLSLQHSPGHIEVNLRHVKLACRRKS